MTIQEERALFLLIAQPITKYFEDEGGVDTKISLPIVTNITQCVFDSLKDHIEVSKKAMNQTILTKEGEDG